MTDSVETEQVAHGGTLRIVYDQDPPNPRKDFDPFGTFIASHRRYNFGDVQVNGQAEIEEHLKSARVVLPVYLYDHSVQRVSTQSFIGRAQHAEWDSGQLGVIYATNAQIRENFALRPNQLITKRVEQQARDLLTAEIEEYDQYISGQVYGYILEDAQGNVLDSCWGFFGLEYALEEGRASATAYADELLAGKAD